MSIEHLNQAFKANIEKSSLKFVLVALADYSNEAGEAYPSVETLCNKTALNHKTVRGALIDLVNLGAIFDTGRRFGSTNQVKVWKLTLENVDSGPKSRNKKSGSNSLEETCESYPKTDTLKIPENGSLQNDQRYPIFPHKVPENGSLKGTQNWVAEPSVLLTTRKEPSDTAKTCKKFRPPTEQMVSDFARELNLNLTGFFEYYASNGWRVGKNPMRDWHMAARGWDKRQAQFKPMQKQSVSEHNRSAAEEARRRILAREKENAQ